MQGAAKTDDFMLGSATIMLGPQADLFNLTEAQSVGLVKNVTMKTTPGFVELTQGVTNSLVYSVMNSNVANITAEAYEYTASNIAYSLSLDGANFEPLTDSTTVATIYAAPVGPATVGLTALVVADATDFEVGDAFLVHTGVADNVMVRKVAAVDVGTDTITMNLGLPMAVAVGAKVEKVNVLAVGGTASAPFLACKIVGTLANGDVVPMLFPKVRVKSGLNMAFKTENFDNIPLELDIFDLVASDPHYAFFSTIGPNGTSAKGFVVG